MPLPAAERIMNELNRRFAAPLPEFYERRIIFWYDEDKSFLEKVEAGEFQLDHAKLITLTGTNTFEVKKLLSHDDCTHNYCVYCPVVFPPEKDWLLPIELYSEEFRADLISMQLEEMQIGSTPLLRKVMKTYASFFSDKTRRMKVAAFHTQIRTPAHLSLAVMASLCGISDMGPNAILRAVLSAGLAEEENGVYQSFVQYKVDRIFWDMVSQMTGYKADESHLMDLACQTFLTALSRTLPVEKLPGLAEQVSPLHQSRCFDFFSEWMSGGDREALYQVARSVEEHLQLFDRFQPFAVEDLIDTDILPCVDECILLKFMKDISAQVTDAAGILSCVEKRRTMLWYDRTANYYEGLRETALMQQFYQEHAAGFHVVEPVKLWKAYTEDYFHMDTDYRLFQETYGKILKQTNERLDDAFKQVADEVERLYVNWFLQELCERWSDSMAHPLENYGSITEVPQQVNFYKSRVKTAESRVFVIISDAMRYDVAAQLAGELVRDSRAEVKLSSMEGIFPTVTKFGMAALLPHEKLTVKEAARVGLAVLADERPTDAGNRETVLKAAEPGSVALKYKDLIRMKMSERRSLVRGKQVVYIYHDTIDAAGHEDETKVVTACKDTIGELKNMVHIITSEFGGTRIFITADHGFLYTSQPLAEDGRVDKTTASTEDVEVDRRYLVTKKGAAPAYLLPVKFIGDEEFSAFAPRGITRIKKRGGGLTFVHGGISPEELVVPVIDYHYMRKDSRGYLQNKSKYDTKPVALTLASASHKISNRIVPLNFYQEDPVGDNRTAAAYKLYFTDGDGALVSDVQRVIADRDSVSNKDRIFRVKFNLKSIQFDPKVTYELVIEEESGTILPVQEPFHIEIAFGMEGFDFFG